MILGQSNRNTSNAMSGVLVGRDGNVNIKVGGAATDLIVDIFGYFTRPERKVTVTTPRGKASAYVYDEQARIKRHVDEYGNERTFSYDSAGYLHRTTDETGRTVTTTHDARGNVSSRTVNDGTGGDRTTFYRYFLGAAGDLRNDAVTEVRDPRQRVGRPTTPTARPTPITPTDRWPR